MKDFQFILAALTGVILFVFGLENFSKEIQRISGERFRKFLSKVTNFTPIGVIIGAGITAVVQSSSATSIIAISLVNAGVLSFKNSVGIIFGSNIGTTITAQLVAFKLTAFAPMFIIIGFFLSFIRSRYSVLAKSLFYFGFVFFSLNLISQTLDPLQNDTRLVSFLTKTQNPFLAILIGGLVTAVLQSSSVTTGLAVIFTQQGLLSLENAIPILIGANIGTTVTAAISIINMDISAKKTALSHFLFNLGGVLIFIPVILLFGDKASLLSKDPAIALANFHLIFNIVTSLVFILALNPFTLLIDKILGEGSMDFERLDLHFQKSEMEFEDAKEGLLSNLDKIFFFLQENYNLVTLSIETNYKSVYETAQKRIEYLDFVKSETQAYFSHIISVTKEKDKQNKIIKIISLYEYVFQIHDSIKDIIKTKQVMVENFMEPQSDLLLLVRELSGHTLSLFNHISRINLQEEDLKGIKKQASDLQEEINSFNQNIFRLMAKPERMDAGAILHLITYSQRLKDKLVNYARLISKYHGLKSDS